MQLSLLVPPLSGSTIQNVCMGTQYNVDHSIVVFQISQQHIFLDVGFLAHSMSAYGPYQLESALRMLVFMMHPEVIPIHS